ncbi:MAG: glycosyltransferase family 39 protein [Methylococcales bacterium]|nr:glycosyltransferase family 39 protein [Methylococcales bacterium]
MSLRFTGLAGLWLLWTLAQLAFRPLLPVDETRYLAVAYEMWQRGDFWVPYLNGQPYSHKPPLLFWLIHLSWAVLGVNEWSARCIGPLAALGVMRCVSGLARQLWPMQDEVPDRTLLMLFGLIGFQLYGSLTLFDMVLTLFVVGAWSLLYRASQQPSILTWLLLGVTLAGGILTKGPVVLIYVLPMALTVRYWLAPAQGMPKRWWTGLVLSLLLAVLLALAWALPAAQAGGEAYREAIFWGQTAGRVVDAFDHRLPWWWYAPHLLWLLFPWAYWLPLWRGVRQLPGSEAGVRLCLIIVSGAWLVLMLLSGKRAHYLLPAMPAVALVLARASVFLPVQQTRPRLMMVTVGMGLLFAVLTCLNQQWGWLLQGSLSVYWGLGLSVLALLAFWYAKPARGQVMLALSVMSAGMTWLVMFGYVSFLALAIDMRPAAHALAALREQGRELAYFDRYHGQYTFYAKLPNGLNIVRNVWDYVCEHPEAILLHDYRKPGFWADDVVFDRYPYRSQEVVFLENRLLRARPALLADIYGKQPMPMAHYDFACLPITPAGQS